MAVVVDVRAPGSTMAEYEAIMKEAGLWGIGSEKVPGLHSHYAWEEDGGVHVLDIWESAEAFNEFFPATIASAAGRAGIEVRPEVKMFPLYNSMT